MSLRTPPGGEFSLGIRNIKRESIFSRKIRAEDAFVFLETNRCSFCIYPIQFTLNRRGSPPPTSQLRWMVEASAMA